MKCPNLVISFKYCFIFHRLFLSWSRILFQINKIKYSKICKAYQNNKKIISIWQVFVDIILNHFLL